MARIDREQLGELLSGYMDGELDPREQQIIERVLREDESARQLLADLRRTAQAVSSLPRHAAPSSILGDTQSALERSALLNDLPEPRPHQTRARLTWVSRLAMAAMVGLVVVTGWWFTADQTRRGTKGSAELVQREVRDADAAKEEGVVDDRKEKSALSRVSRTREVSTTSDAGRGAGGLGATFEQQLAAGVDPSSLRSQAFTVEPVRLQVMVRDRSEREALAAKVSKELSRQRIVDLAAVPGPRTDTTASAQRFYYRGKAGVNFEAADEDQILVRASPQQIDRLLMELAGPGVAGDSVAMAAGPIAVQGVEKSRSLVRLLGEQPKPTARPESTEYDDRLAFAEGVGPLESDGGSPENSEARDGGMLGGLLRIVGIDPDLLSTGTASAPESAPPPSPPPLVERRLKAVTESGRESAGKDAPPPAAPKASEAVVTVVVQIIERPKPVESDKPAKPKSDRPPTSKSIN